MHYNTLSNLPLWSAMQSVTVTIYDYVYRIFEGHYKLLRMLYNTL